LANKLLNKWGFSMVFQARQRPIRRPGKSAIREAIFCPRKSRFSIGLPAETAGFRPKWQAAGTAREGQSSRRRPIGPWLTRGAPGAIHHRHRASPADRAPVERTALISPLPYFRKLPQQPHQYTCRDITSPLGEIIRPQASSAATSIASLRTTPPASFSEY
jgi:hypothetical protein